MIQAMIFDLDGTLVQTERLKALSYTRAAVELCPYHIQAEEVMEAFKNVVGLPRREVAISLMERFDLREKSRQRMEEFGVATPWQAYVQVRLGYYSEMLSNPQVLRSNRWAHTTALLAKAQQIGCQTALATMSRGQQTQRVLKALDLVDAFDFTATRDDVERGKPDPEIYQLVSQKLAVIPAECLVIEDSPSGVEAALAAGMWCIAVSTPFTKQKLHAEQLLDESWIVDDPDTLLDVVDRKIQKLQPA